MTQPALESGNNTSRYEPFIDGDLDGRIKWVKIVEVLVIRRSGEASQGAVSLCPAWTLRRRVPIR